MRCGDIAATLLAKMRIASTIEALSRFERIPRIPGLAATLCSGSPDPSHRTRNSSEAPQLFDCSPVYEVCGGTDQAIAMYDKYLAMRPSVPEVERRLRGLRQKKANIERSR
jgi:hypothetical protein